jgi:hypothetical protein
MAISFAEGGEAARAAASVADGDLLVALEGDVALLLELEVVGDRGVVQDRGIGAAFVRLQDHLEDRDALRRHCDGHAFQRIARRVGDLAGEAGLRSGQHRGG